MGLFRMSPNGSVVPGQPVPYRFVVERVHEGPRGVAARVRYPDATNYEGVKILVFLNTSAAQVRSARVLDPHFRAGSLSPFARFEPTRNGWQAACALVGGAN